MDRRIQRTVEEFAKRVKDWDLDQLEVQYDEINKKIDWLKTEISFGMILIDKLGSYPKKLKSAIKYKFENEFDFRKSECDRQIEEINSDNGEKREQIKLFEAQGLFIEDKLNEMREGEKK